MVTLDPKGPSLSAQLDGCTYELHRPAGAHHDTLVAFDSQRRLSWHVPLHLGDLTAFEMRVAHDPLTARVLLTVDGVHARGGTRLLARWFLAPDGVSSRVFELDEGELKALSEAQRRALLTVVMLAASSDGRTDPRELAVVRGLLDGWAWGVADAVITNDLQAAQVQARSVRSAADVVALGRSVADALLPHARDKLVRLLLDLGWADGAMRPEEHWVIAAFLQGIGMTGERANALADAAADRSVFAAIPRGRVDVVRRLLEHGASVSDRDPRGWTVLHVAVATGQQAIVDLLVEKGADVHAKHDQGSAPLLLACNKPYPAIAERLLRAGARVDEAGGGGLTPLMIAALFGQTAVARVLLTGGASLELVDEVGRTPLHAAASEGRSGTVSLLLAAGAQVDARTKKGCTPMMHAAGRGDLATVTALLAAKADVNAADVDQETPLHYATLGNAPEIVSLLLAFGARVDAASSKQVTPLHVAAGAGYTSCARLLLDAGATVDAKNIEGGTPLFMAAVRDCREVHELLVSRGANLDAPTTFGTTPRGSVGAGLATKSLRSAPFAPLPAAVFRPDDGALAAHDDYQIAAWMNLDGTPDQVLVGGKDERGRDQYVGRPGSGEVRARLVALTDESGKRWLPVFTSDAASAAFVRAAPIGWPSDGMGLARAVMGNANAKIFALGGLPVDGIVVNPYGPAGPIKLTAEECDRVARRVR